MYFSKHKHLLSVAIMLSAVIRLAGSLLEGVVRMIVNRSTNLSPDMMDAALWNAQAIFSALEIVAIFLVFFLSWRKLRRYTGLIDEDDRGELGRLQEEVFGSHLSTLSAESIEQLLQIWGVILAGAEVVYYVSSLIYKRFTTELMLLVLGGGGQVTSYTSFVSIYNLTHGFKYLEMFTAILLGVAMTAIFLHDRYLKITAIVITALFLMAFGIFQMQTLSLAGRQIGIVWTSVIYHLTETLGLFALSLYLSRRYKGL